MAALFWLSDAQWAVMEPFMPRNQPGARRVDDRRTISGIVHVIRSGCRWQDCPRDYGPPTTVYNRFNRWSRRGFWRGMLSALAEAGWIAESASLDSTMGCEGSKGLYLVGVHEPRVVGNVGAEDRRELPFDPFGAAGHPTELSKRHRRMQARGSCAIPPAQRSSALSSGIMRCPTTTRVRQSPSTSSTDLRTRGTGMTLTPSWRR